MAEKAKEVPLDPAVETVVRQIERAEAAYHNAWVEEVDQRYDDYHSLVEDEDDDDPEDWHSRIFPPYMIPIIEGMKASMVEPNLRLLAKPRPRPNEPPDEVVQRVNDAKVAEVAVNWAMDNDRFGRKQGPFMQQDMITGLTVGKYFWDERKKTVYERRFYDDVEEDEYGELQPVRGSEVVEYEDKIRDDPTFKIIDVRDFFWPANCTDINDATWLADRIYMTARRLQELEELGVYDKGTVEAAKQTSLAQQGKPGERRRYDEGGSEGPLRTQGLYEVIECWWTDRVITVVNREVLARDKPNGFWHGKKPYIVCCAIPNLGQVNGKSIVEVLAPIQKMLQFIQNQRLDNLKLLNNLIYVIRSDVDDAHSFKWYPGAQWFLESVDQVKELPIDPTPATVSMQAESMLKGDLQNLMGGLPYSGSTESSTIDQKTATGVSIITSIAQRVIEARKQAYTAAFVEVGVAFLDLLKQFLVEPRTVSLLGPGGAPIWVELDPEKFQGGYEVYYDIQGDSLVRQERRAEAQSLYQVAVQGAQMHAMMGTPLNLDEFMRKLLVSFDEPNPQVYFLTPQQAQALQASKGGGAPQNGQMPPGQGTAPAPNPADQGMVPAGMGPLGSQGNAVTAAPGPGVSTDGMQQQFLAPTGPQQ